MGLFLSNVLTRLASPLDVGLLLGILAAVLVWWGRRRAAVLALGLGLVPLWLFSVPFVSAHLRASLERHHLPVAIPEMPSANVIVVLGGGVGGVIPPRLTADLGSAADRVLHAARLYRAGKAPLVIAAGGRVAWKPGTRSEADAMSELLREWGVPDAALRRETTSRNTRENAVNVKRLLDEEKLETVILVTSALHMPRALATFRAVGVDAIPAPTDFGAVDLTGGHLLRWLPDAESLASATRALKELLALRVYAWRGWAV